MIHGALWVCEDCGRVFDTPYIDSGHGECPDVSLCPGCKSDQIAFADMCLECGETFKESDLEYGICEECMRNLAYEHAHEFITSDREAWDAFAWYMHQRLTRR